MNKIQISAVSYLNTKPLLYGLLKSSLADRIKLKLEIPSECANSLLSGKADLALVPVAILPQLSTPQVISDYCIGTVGAVKTVAIYSEYPLEQVKSLYLDHHSRTSVALTRILLEEHWKVQPELIPASEGYIGQIKKERAGLVIGDRTIGLEQRYPFVYDLGQAWMDYTGMPFVFAAWVSNRPLPYDFIQEFNQALQKGLAAIPELMYLLPSPHPDFDLEAYYTRYISYELDAAKRKALTLFLEKITSSIQPSLEASLSL